MWGIVLLMLTGLLEFAIQPSSPWNEVFAGLFGVGAGLTLDEFALWIYLRDVYWAEEGRKSVDACSTARGERKTCGDSAGHFSGRPMGSRACRAEGKDQGDGDCSFLVDIDDSFLKGEATVKC